MATAAEIRAAMDKVTNAYQLGTPTKKSKPKAPKKAAKKAGPPKSQQAAAGRKATASRKGGGKTAAKAKMFSAAKGTAANPYKATAVRAKDGLGSKADKAREREANRRYEAQFPEIYGKGKGRGKKSSRSTEARLG